jgi:hypothetical protein
MASNSGHKTPDVLRALESAVAYGNIGKGCRLNEQPY